MEKRAHVGVPKTNTRRRAQLIVGWMLLAAPVLVVIIGAVFWTSVELG